MEDEVKKHMREAIYDAKSLWFDGNNQQIIYELAVVLFMERKELSEVLALLKDYENEDKDNRDDEKGKSKINIERNKFMFDDSSYLTLSKNKFIIQSES